MSVVELVSELESSNRELGGFIVLLFIGIAFLIGTIAFPSPLCFGVGVIWSMVAIIGIIFSKRKSRGYKAPIQSSSHSAQIESFYSERKVEDNLQNQEDNDSRKGDIKEKQNERIGNVIKLVNPIVFEEDLKKILLGQPDLVDPGLTIIADEYRCGSGNIDIFARDSKGFLVIVELKRGKLSRSNTEKVYGQLSHYMYSIKDEKETENVRGIIIAEDFDRIVDVYKDIEVLRYEVWS